MKTTFGLLSLVAATAAFASNAPDAKQQIDQARSRRNAAEGRAEDEFPDFVI